MQNQNIMISILRKKNKYLFLLVGFSFVALLPAFVFAQNAVSISVSPAIYEMNASPGQIWESKLRIVNNNAFELTVYAETVNFRPLGEDGTSQFLPKEPADGESSTLAQWIGVPKSSLVIPPEQTLEIPIRIELPDDAPPGGHYAAVLVGTRPPEDRDSNTRVETSQIVSSLIFLRVAGDIDESGHIRSFRTTQSIIESPTATFEMRFENTGNVHLRPEGEIRIYNMWGQERGVIPINRHTLFGNILSSSIRSFNFTWTGEWSPADIGRYTAEATLAFGEDERRFASSETAFWLIPWRVLLVIIAVIGSIIWLLTWLVKMYVRRMLSLAGLSEENPLQQKLATTRRREVSVVAPIEAGILDLRSRLQSNHAHRLSVLVKYIAEYKLFFIGVVIVLLTVYMIFWFANSVSESDREFEVTIKGAGEAVTVNSESMKYEQQQTDIVVAKRDVPPVRLVNRSGESGAAAKVALVLEELGFTIESVSTDLNATERRTVIVFDPSAEEASLELSTVLDNALLSAYVIENEADPLITVYVGSDIAD